MRATLIGWHAVGITTAHRYVGIGRVFSETDFRYRVTRSYGHTIRIVRIVGRIGIITATI